MIMLPVCNPKRGLVRPVLGFRGDRYLLKALRPPHGWCTERLIARRKPGTGLNRECALVSVHTG